MVTRGHIVISADVCRVKVKVEMVSQVIFKLVFESRDGELEIERGNCVPQAGYTVKVQLVRFVGA